jgi:hypothetical protein
MHPALRRSTAHLTIAAFSCAFLLSACKKSQSPQQASPTPQNQVAQTPAAGAMSVDDLVAPIALYPDQLLGQVLIAATTPQEVLDLGNWLLQNQNLQGDAASGAAKQAGFSASAQYLSLFPQVVDNMCQEMDWTTQLGDAFKSNQKSVMDAVQRKRQQAQQAGNLQSSPQMTVATKTDNGQQYVEIKPADPKTVYVPQYNPVTIYNTNAPAAAPAQTTTTTTASTTEETKSGVSTGAAIGIGLLSFGVGMAVGHAISDNNNYYPYPSWGYGGVYYGGRPYYPPPYRPPVYPGYRPAYVYRPPANYHWSQYNRNVNVNVNNNNYYGRFDNNRARNNTGYAGTNNYQNNRLGQNNQGNFRGQSTYQGAHAMPRGEKPGASMANVNPNTRSGARNIGADRNSAPNAIAQNRSAAPTPASSQHTMASNHAMASNNRNMNSGVTSRSQPVNRGGDRGYSAPNPTASPSTSTNRGARGGGAFDSGTSGRADRAASNRGRSSMGASRGNVGGRHRR